jgi:DNA modification methylase
MADWKNKLFFGNNLGILRDEIPAESVDLIYLDPPFNSKANYNILFKERSGKESAAQILAFEDTWHWGSEAEIEYHDIVTEGPKEISDLMQAFRNFLRQTDMMAYIAMMAPRILALHRVLKPTGSIYLHCDPTASHYLKLIMDAVFGPTHFRNEIIWRRTGSHNKLQRYGPVHDTIFFYTKSDDYVWNSPKRPYMRGHIQEYFVLDEHGYRTNYYGNVLTGSGLRGGESGKPWQGVDPSAKGRHWAVPGAVIEDIDEDLSDLGQHEKLDRLLELGYIKLDPEGGWPVYERRLKPTDGQFCPDIWAFQPYTGGTVFGTEDGIDEDVRWLSPKDQERLGYPTQKPEALLERIIGASSNEGQVVLDPFCGCGTTITVAERMKRRWLGIDITHLAIALMKYRLQNTMRTHLSPYEVFGVPTDLESATALALEGRYKFQNWAVGMIGVHPLSEKKGADEGIDGYEYFQDDKSGKFKTMIVQVKSGNVKSGDIRDLKGAMTREKAEIAVFITLKPPTTPMKKEAHSAGFYESKFFPGTLFPKMQILSVEELFEGKMPQYPKLAVESGFKRAQTKGTLAVQGKLL